MLFRSENGNCGAAVTMRSRARDSAEDAEPMCALSRRQSLLGGEGIPARLEASLSLLARSLAASVMPSRGEVPRRGKNPREAHQAWRASPGLESLVLSKISLKSYVGPGRPAHGTLVSTVLTREAESCRRRRSEGGNAAGIHLRRDPPPPTCSSSTSTARSSHPHLLHAEGGVVFLGAEG